LLGLLCLKAFPLGIGFLSLCGRLGLEGLLLRGKLPLLLVCVLLLLGLLCPYACKLGLSLWKHALASRIRFRSIRGRSKLHPMGLGLRLRPCLMHCGLRLVLHVVKCLRSLRHHAGDLLWIALYNDGLSQKVLLQVLLNNRLCMLLYVSTSINLHVHINVLVPVGREHGWRRLLPSSLGSKATGRSFPMV
jgi:hypothetical protein